MKANNKDHDAVDWWLPARCIGIILAGAVAYSLLIRFLYWITG